MYRWCRPDSVSCDSAVPNVSAPCRTKGVRAVEPGRWRHTTQPETRVSDLGLACATVFAVDHCVPPPRLHVFAHSHPPHEPPDTSPQPQQEATKRTNRYTCAKGRGSSLSLRQALRHNALPHSDTCTHSQRHTLTLTLRHARTPSDTQTVIIHTRPAVDPHARTTTHTAPFPQYHTPAPSKSR